MRRHSAASEAFRTMLVSALSRIAQLTTCFHPRSVTCRTASPLNSSDYRSLLMSTFSWAVFHRPEMFKQDSPYQLGPVEALQYAAR